MNQKNTNIAFILLTLICFFVLPSKADVSKQANWTVASGGNGHTYRVVAKSGLISWDSADAEAQAAGGYLATITSAAENAFVFSLIDDPTYWKQTINGHGPWIGGYQKPGSIEPDGGWTWVTQTGASAPEPFIYTNWESGEPNNLTTTVSGTNYNQDRVAFFHSGTGRDATWSDEYNLANANLNQWTMSYVIEFNPISPVLQTPILLSDGSVQLSFTNIPAASFTILMSTNLVQHLTNWTVLGTATEISPGQYQFKDTPNSAQRFYRVKQQ